MGIGELIVGAIGIFSSGSAIGAAVAFGIETAISLAANSLFRPKQPGGAGVRQGRTENLRANSIPHHAIYGECRKGGLIFYINGTGDNNNFLHIGLTVAAHQSEAIENVHFNGEEIVLDGGGNATGSLANFARILWKLGDPNQTEITEMAAENDNWSTDHRARGHTYIYAKLTYSQDKFPNFIPSITARVKGQNQIWDPRDSSYKWTDNPALCVADVMERYLKVPRSRIDEAHLIEAANVCDEIVTRKDTSTEKRYTCGGFFELEGDPEEWMIPFLSAMGGNVTEHGGIYYISAGVFKSAVLTITDEDVVSGIKYRTAESDYRRSNSAKGIFVGIDSYDQPTDFPAVQDTVAVTEDGGVVNWLELDYEFVPSHTQAQRLASIALRSSREDETVNLSVNLLKGLDIKPWDTVELDIEAVGLSGTWQVITHTFNVDVPMSVDLVLKRHTAAVYDWDPQTQEKPLSLNFTNIPGAEMAAVSNLSYSLVTNATDPDHHPATATYSWSDPTGSFEAIELETVLDYEYREQGSSDPWVADSIAVSDTAIGSAVEERIIDYLNNGITNPNGFEFRNWNISTARIRTRITASSWTAWQDIPEA